ncbi:MAG: N-6 DNA methylase [Melioribacteraceae bacterium]|nr:N-6 DNA methylase [Melioribacteraceae bacterium]
MRQEKTIAFLEDQHIKKIYNAYKNYENLESFSKVISIEEVSKNNYSLSIPLYVSNVQNNTKEDINSILRNGTILQKN